MTVGELQRAIAGLPSDMAVVLTSFDERFGCDVPHEISSVYPYEVVFDTARYEAEYDTDFLPIDCFYDHPDLPEDATTTTCVVLEA